MATYDVWHDPRAEPLILDAMYREDHIVTDEALDMFVALFGDFLSVVTCSQASFELAIAKRPDLVDRIPPLTFVNNATPARDQTPLFIFTCAEHRWNDALTLLQMGANPRIASANGTACAADFIFGWGHPPQFWPNDPCRRLLAEALVRRNVTPQPLSRDNAQTHANWTFVKQRIDACRAVTRLLVGLRRFRSKASDIMVAMSQSSKDIVLLIAKMVDSTHPWEWYWREIVSREASWSKRIKLAVE